MKSDLASASHGFRQELILDYERGEGGEIILSDPVTGAYGVGDPLNAALGDFMSMFVEQYEELRASEQLLSLQLRERFAYLNAVMAPR